MTIDKSTFSLDKSHYHQLMQRKNYKGEVHVEHKYNFLFVTIKISGKIF